MDYCSEFQASRQNTVRGRRFWSRISSCGPFLVHGDCHVSKKAASVVAIPMIWPVGVYTWWFMHSDAAKRIYGVELE
jgi:hypothetical protein